MLTNSVSIKLKIQFRNWLQEEKTDQETNIKNNILTELERVAAATSLRTEESPPPDASTAAATSSSGMDSAETGEPLLAAMACRRKDDALSSNTIVLSLWGIDYYYKWLNWKKREKEHENSEHKKESKRSTKITTKSSKRIRNTNQKEVKLKTKITNLKN